MGELIDLRSSSGELSARIDRATGSLVQLNSASLAWEAIGRRRGARPFDLLLPLGSHRRNRTRGAAQPRPEVTEHAEGTFLELHWPSVVSEAGGAHDII